MYSIKNGVILMSENDKKKEQQELKVFIEAYDYSQIDVHTHLKTKDILKSIKGESINREKNDSPDLIFHSFQGTDERYIGVEIFSVDQDSIRKGKSYRSESKENKAKLDRIHSEMRKQIDETGIISEDVKDKNLAATFDYAKGHVNSGYKIFMDAFRFHFEKHAQNISKYRSNVEAVANGCRTELAFFIEIEAETNDWFANPINNEPIEKVTTMPFFAEMISIIDSFETVKLLDYIVFYIHDLLKKRKQVVAIKANDSTHQLEEQNITIYHYVGEQDFSAKISGSVTNMILNTKEDSSIEEDVFPLYFKAVQMKKDNQPFVTSREVQHLLYICPHARDKKEFDSYLQSIGRDKMHQLSKRFSTLYGKNQ